MTYFEQLKVFLASYRVSSWDTLKLIALYPVFKLHFWFYYRNGQCNRLAKAAFKLFPRKSFFTVQLYLPALDAYVPVPIWLQPDRLSSFREIFWGHSYRIRPEWTPSMLVDAGANAGYVCLYVAGYGGVKKILAIEANLEFHGVLEWTARVLGKHGIEMRVMMGAVVGKPRHIVFEVMDNDRDSRVADPTAAGNLTRTLTVKGQRLGDWLRESGLADAAARGSVLLKADIEGSEYEMLSEQPGLLDSFDYLIMEVHGGRETRDKLVLQQIAGAHRILDRQSNPAYPEVEVLFSEHRRLHGMQTPLVVFSASS